MGYNWPCSMLEPVQNTHPPFRSILVAAHPRLPAAVPEAGKVATYLQAHGAAAVCGLLSDEDLRQRMQDGEFDLLIALGGDGSMLRAGHLSAPVDVPVLGINLGRFGFLTEIRHDQWPQVLPRLFAGEYWLEKRMMLHAEHGRGDEKLGEWDVLNEIVVTRGHMVSPIHLETSLDGRFLTTFVADGLIAATATGSTAYALAAGGPILPPELRNILLIAVAPHLSIDRAIVLAEGACVSITFEEGRQAVLSPDGQVPTDLERGDWVDVSASQHAVRFVRFQDPGYFYRNLTQHMNRNPTTGNHR
jgi:NAD+ kinase